MDDYISLVKSFKNMIFKIIAYFIVTNFVVGSVLYFLHIGAQKEGLFNEISEKAHTIGSSIELLLDKAINAGIPFTEIKGLQEYLDMKLKSSEELEYIFVTDVKGNVVAQTQSAPNPIHGNLKQFSMVTDPIKDQMKPFKIFSYVNIPITILIEEENNKHYGYLHLGVSVKAVQNKISDIFFDIAIILFVSLVVGFEFIRFTFINYVATPIGDFLAAINRMAKGDLSLVSSLRASTGIYRCLEKLNDLIYLYCSKIRNIIIEFEKIGKKNFLYELIKDNINEIKSSVLIPKGEKPDIAPLSPAIENLRLVVFLSLICEGIILTISPGYAGQFYVENPYISKQFFSSLPVLLFILTSVLTLPLGLVFTNKYGFRRTFQFGLVLYCVGFLMPCTFPDSIFAFLACRFFSGMGFGILYFAFQNYVSTYSVPERRVEHFSIYLVAQGAAFLTGMPVGGLLVDNIGYFYIIVLSTVIILFAILYSGKYILDYQGFEKTESRPPLISPFKITKIPGLSRIILCLAFPTRFLYTALLAVLDPLYLTQLGNSMSIVGRVLMIYGIFVFCMSPHAYRVVSFFKRPVISCVLCNVLIGISLLVQYTVPTTQGVVIALTMYSVGAVIHVSSMMALLENFVKENSVPGGHQYVISIYFTYERIAMLFAPLISGICIAHLGYELTALFFCVSILGANLVFIFLEKNKLSLFTKRS